MAARHTRHLPLAAGMLAVALAVTGCGGDSGKSADTGGKVLVVASTNVWASVAQAVGGDAITVKSVLSDPSADPHGYEAKPADATLFTGAKLAVSNGGGYDDFFAKLADGADGGIKKVVAFDLAGKGESGHDHPASEPAAPAGAHDHAEADAHGHAHGANEHVWYDLETVHKVAEKVAAELGAITPDKKDTFLANATAFGGKLDDLAVKAAEIGAKHPGGKVIATEPVAAYLLEVAGLQDVTPEEFTEAIEEETDPPAATVAATTELVSGKQVIAVIYNDQTETPVTKALKDAATKAGIPIVAVSETLPQGTTDYLGWMTKQVEGLSAALGAA